MFGVFKSLPQRKFELGQRVCVVVGEIHCGRIIGYEDGRQLRKGKGCHDGWVYYIRADQGDELGAVAETDLEELKEEISDG